MNLTDARANKAVIGAGDWNPRYVSYAKSFGNTPEQQLEQDRRVYPGGIMTGFTLWIQHRWAEWIDEFKLKPLRAACPKYRKSDLVTTDDDHNNFTYWLRTTFGG